MNARTEADRTKGYRWANGWRAMTAATSPEELRRRRQAGFRAALSVYGDSDELRALRASDIRRKRTLTAAEWRRLMRRRERAYGLPPGTLCPAAQTTPVAPAEVATT